MTVGVVRKFSLLMLLSFSVGMSTVHAAKRPVELPDGRVIPGQSCGSFVTTIGEREAILMKWLGAPALIGVTSLTAAVLMRRRLRRVVDQQRRTRWAVLVGLLGAVSLLSGLHVLFLGSLHAFGVFSLYEPMF